MSGKPNSKGGNIESINFSTFYFTVVGYHCTFNNCSDTLYVEWKNENGKFIVTRWYGDTDAIHYCPKCDADFDEPLCFLEDYDPKEDYICPECGAKLEIDANKIITELKLVNGEWEVQEEIFAYEIEEK